MGSGATGGSSVSQVQAEDWPDLSEVISEYTGQSSNISDLLSNYTNILSNATYNTNSSLYPYSTAIQESLAQLALAKSLGLDLVRGEDKKLTETINVPAEYATTTNWNTIPTETIFVDVGPFGGDSSNISRALLDELNAQGYMLVDPDQMHGSQVEMGSTRYNYSDWDPSKIYGGAQDEEGDGYDGHSYVKFQRSSSPTTSQQLVRDAYSYEKEVGVLPTYSYVEADATPSAEREAYLDELRANLGTNVGSGIGADYTSRGLLNLEEEWRQYYQNLAQELSGNISTSDVSNETAAASTVDLNDFLSYIASVYGSKAGSTQAVVQNNGNAMTSAASLISALGSL